MIVAEWSTVTSAGNTSDESDSDSIQALLDELLGPSGHDNPASTTDSGIRTPTTSGGEPVDREPGDRRPSGGATLEADPVQKASAESASVAGRPPGTSSGDGSPNGLHDGEAAHGPSIDADGWTVNGVSGAVPGHEATQVMDRPFDATLTMPAGRVSPVITGRPGAGTGVTARRGVGGASILKVAVLTVLGLYAVLVAAWSIDLFRHQGEVMRGIEFADTSLQGMSRSAVGEVVEQQNGVLAERSLEISVGDVTVGTDPVTAGATLDGDAITNEAFDHGRIGFFPFDR